MAQRKSFIGAMSRAAATAGCLAALIAAGSAVAQDKKAAPAAPADKKAAPAAAAAADPNAKPQSVWVKLCDKVKILNAEKKEEEKTLCLTHHERLDAAAGMTIVSAAIRQLDGQPKQDFLVMVNTGAGIVIPADILVKFDGDKENEGTKLKYEMCQPTVCQASTEVTPAILDKMKKGKGFLVVAINAGKQPMGFPVALTGFTEALDGPPTDTKLYAEARQRLMQQLAQQQRSELEKNPELAKAVKAAEEAQQKVAAEAQKIQAQQAAAAPAAGAPAAAAAPAAKDTAKKK